ncbi:MAG: hypothetical protein LW865_14505 [Betaproteobacteria bacterium]|jgi:hypothetical protein|nr:hypothetical protein [Betaproteobacteria bacterium]
MTTATQDTGAATPMQSGMAEVLARRKEETKTEFVMQDKGDEGKKPVEDKTDSTDADTQLAAQLGDTIDPSAYATTKIKIKVDGEEREVTLDEVTKSFQIESAARKRMTEATQTKAEADRLLAEAKEKAAKPTPSEGTSGNSNTEVIEKYKAQAEALLEGDTDKYAELAVEIQQLTGASSTAMPDVEKLTKDLVPKIKQQMTVESAYDAFTSTYSDVVANPILYQMSVEKYHELTAEGKDAATAFTEAGEHARSEVRKMAEAQGMVIPTPSTATKQDRLDVKRQATSTTNVKSASQTAQSTLTPPKTRAEVLAQMAKSRGQTPPT